MIDRWRAVDLHTDASDFAPLAEDETAVRVTDTLAHAQYEAIAALLRDRPDAALWIDDRSPDLEMLRFFPGLRRLRVTSLRKTSWDGLRHVAETLIGAAMKLRELRVQSMSAVTELPSLRDLSHLRRVALDTMKGITDLRPVADAPALEELFLVAMCHLDPIALRPLVGHPSLRKGIWGLCSDRKNAEAWDLLPLGDPPWNYEGWKARTAGG